MTVFTPPGDPSLRKSALEVPENEILSKEIQGIIDQMLDIARGERADLDKRIMIGLAAPQIGIDKQIILVDMGVGADRKKLGELKAYINPKILWTSSEKVIDREGCFSVDGRVRGLVERAISVKIAAFDREGHFVIEEHSGFTARIFQHEIDHLQGIRFPDRVGEEGLLHWVEEEEYSDYRQHWQDWPKRCPWNLWLAMREGKEYKKPGGN